MVQPVENAEMSNTDSAQLQPEVLRLALVLNGGVSLAVWMGGVAREIDAIMRATGTENDHSGAYHRLLDVARTEVVVDVISGTSAGGINGACLALSAVNKNARIGALRDLWAEQGSLDTLLRPPFKGQPTSLLRGDDYFLPELTKAMRGLTAEFDPDAKASVELIITTTLLGGARTLTTDGLGQALPQQRHGAHFRFSTDHQPVVPGDTRRNDFDLEHIEGTSVALGLAARCTAGFPFAFEPTFVPVRSGTVKRPQPPAQIDGRPNMWPWASWARAARMRTSPPEKAEDLSKFAVDGGLLANTPTREALEAIDRQPPGPPLRRVMLMVFPHAPVYDPDVGASEPPDEAQKPPTVVGAAGGLLSSLSSQGSQTFVEEVDAHNRQAAKWRGGRREVLDLFDLAKLYSLVAEGWPYYQAARMSAAARHLSERVLRPPGWDYARVVRAAHDGQRSWPGETHRALPYVPKTFSLQSPPQLEARRRGEHPRPRGRWDWGTTVALGIADSVTEVLRAAQGIVSDEGEAEKIESALRTVATARDEMQVASDAFDVWWLHQAGLERVAPTSAYWMLRLDCYREAMQGARGGERDYLRAAVKRLNGLDGKPLSEDDQRVVLHAVEGRGWLRAAAPMIPGGLGNDPNENELGDRTAAAVWTCVTALSGCSEVIQSVAAAEPTHSPLTPWVQVLSSDRVTVGVGRPGRRPTRTWAEPEHLTLRLLTRLLAVDAATWMFADAESAGTSQELKLAQLSLNIEHHFARFSTTPDDKVAGSELNRFGGFLKQSWRINDWTWGRLDGAQMLCRLVLDPVRLHRIYGNRSGTVDPVTAADAAKEVVTRLVDPAYSPDDPAGFSRLRDAAVAELTDLFVQPDVAGGYLPKLAKLAAHPIQQRIIVAELPALADAIKSDQVLGANPRSRGETFLRVEDDLLTALEKGGPDLALTKGDAALAAFDRAGIGREALSDEMRSDAMIQTALTTAATVITVADGEQLGVTVVKPFTKAIRGAALLPYWLIRGLLAGSGTARAIALLGFALGGVALVLGLLGLLGPVSTAGTTVGAGVVVGAFSYAALRSGTLLHGVALAGIAVPLIALSDPARHVRGEVDPQASGVALASVAAIGLGLVVLASLPNPVRSPAAVLLNPRQWIPKAVAVLVAGGVAALVAAIVVAVTSSQDSWKGWYDEIDVSAARLATVAVIVSGVASAWFRGRGMRRWEFASVLKKSTKQWVPTWRLEEHVSAPSGVSASWAPIYGTTYLLVAWGASWWLRKHPERNDPQLSDADTWQLLAVTWWAVVGTVLCVLGPLIITFWARRTLRKVIIRKFAALPSDAQGDLRGALESRGWLYKYLTQRFPRKAPTLNSRGDRLQDAIEKERDAHRKP